MAKEINFECETEILNYSEHVPAQGAINENQGASGISCPIYPCRKTFPSKKALHGHMRSHPERGWRGMVRPPGGNIRTNLKKKIGKKNDDEFSTMKWLVKARRGRKGKMPHYNTDLKETDPVYIAGCILMHIRYRFPSSSSDDFETSSGSYEDVLLRDLPKNGLNHENKTDKMQMDDEKEIESSGTSICGLTPIKNDKNINQSSKSYSCQLCNKTFSTHQALGGHTASHNKVKGTIYEANNHNNNTILATEDQKDEEFVSKFSPRTAEKEYKCKICYVVYSSGQALGGHMRLHYHPSATLEEPSQIMHRFDLNEIPKFDTAKEEVLYLYSNLV